MSSDSTDDAVEQINDAVEDGGGCTEAWEALSELREGNASNRRGFLKGLGTAGGTAALLSAGAVPVIAKEKRMSTSKEVRNALNSEEVQSILDGLGEPEVHRKESRSRDITVGDESAMQTTISTAAGDIQYTAGSVIEPTAHYRFKDSEMGNVPNRYQDIPTGTQAMLASVGGGVILARGPTESEQRQLARATELEADDFIAGMRSDTEGFVVRSTEDYQTAYRVTLDDGSVTTLNDDVVTTSDGPGWCLACLAAAGACFQCAPMCVIPSPLCFGCVITACGAGVYACTKCAQKCGCS